jgi:hypothetical protein
LLLRGGGAYKFLSCHISNSQSTIMAHSSTDSFVPVNQLCPEFEVKTVVNAYKDLVDTGKGRYVQKMNQRVPLIPAKLKFTKGKPNKFGAYLHALTYADGELIFQTPHMLLSSVQRAFGGGGGNNVFGQQDQDYSQQQQQQQDVTAFRFQTLPTDQCEESPAFVTFLGMLSAAIITYLRSNNLELDYTPLNDSAPDGSGGFWPIGFKAKVTQHSRFSDHRTRVFRKTTVIDDAGETHAVVKAVALNNVVGGQKCRAIVSFQGVYAGMHPSTRRPTAFHRLYVRQIELCGNDASESMFMD